MIFNQLYLIIDFRPEWGSTTIYRNFLSINYKNPNQESLRLRNGLLHLTRRFQPFPKQKEKSERMKVYKSYFGGKAATGSYQQIINCIRPHDIYVEPFAGGGAVALNKRQAAVNIINDIDPAVVDRWFASEITWAKVYNLDAIAFLSSFIFDRGKKYVIYLDPPYPLSSRKSARSRYKFEMTDAQHLELLSIVRGFPANVDVLISTYPNELYTEALQGFRFIEYNSPTRGGVATERLYMNYANEAGLLHDYSYLGDNYTERQQIRRKIAREIEKLKRLPATERNAIIAAIQEWAGTVKNDCDPVQLELTMLPGKK